MTDNENTTHAEILDICLTHLQSDDADLETCLRQFPEHAEQIAPLLEIAHQINAAFSPSAPDATYAKNAKIRVLNRLRALEAHASPAEKQTLRRRRPRWRPARAIVSILLAVVLVSTSAGVAWASSDALPGDPLYAVKRGVEEFRLGITFSDDGDFVLLDTFTTERLDEFEALLQAGREEDLAEALDGYEDMLERLIEQASESAQSEGDAALNQLEFSLQHHAGVLARVQENAPESAQAKIEKAKEKTQHGKDVVDYIRQGGDPSDLAPGQQKKLTPQSEPGSEGHGPGKDKTPKPKDKKTPGPPPWANPGGERPDDED